METPQNMSLDESFIDTSEYSSPQFKATKPYHGATTPQTVASTPSTYSPSASLQDYSYALPVPSASRPRIDPRYASRISSISPSYQHHTTASSGSNFRFRPAPIVTSGWSTNDARTPTPRSRPDAGVSDRFIPNRATSRFHFSLWDQDTVPGPSASEESDVGIENSSSSVLASTTTSRSSQQLLNTLLRSELLGENDYPAPAHSQSQNTAPPLAASNNLRYMSPRQLYQSDMFGDVVGSHAAVNHFSLSPIRSPSSQRLMAAPPKRKRRISKVPFKVLDAPQLQDDFYLNLVDWSSQNVLAVALGACVYLWSACTSKVTKLCDLSESEETVTSVSWAQRGFHLAIGTNRGDIQIWDAIKCQRVRNMTGHVARVGTLAWNGNALASGSRDRLIFLRDLRQQTNYTHKLVHHKQEVCGLKWSFESTPFLASGGNDNNLHVIDSRNPESPLHRFTDHVAAVKAIAWSPHQHGVLASGGGTADRCIRFWNTLSGTNLNKIDTGSQVCNLAWSQNCNELVSTHGYSLNQIVVWRYPSMTKLATLTGHTYRVLYLAMSPDGTSVVTGAGDETLRFWQIFPGAQASGKDTTGGLLFPNTPGSVIR